MLLETWIIAEIPANSQKCSLLDFSGETDILYLLSSNHSAPAMNRVTLIKQLFSDYNKFSPEPETRALSVWEHAWTSWLSTFNSHPKLQALSSPPIQSQRTLVCTQALFLSSKDIINLQWCLYIWQGNSSKKPHNHPTRQLFPTIVNKLYIMSPKCMFWVAFEISKKKKKRFVKENFPTNQLKPLKLQ